MNEGLASDGGSGASNLHVRKPASRAFL